jgi:hypothetical protein
MTPTALANHLDKRSSTASSATVASRAGCAAVPSGKPITRLHIASRSASRHVLGMPRPHRHLPDPELADSILPLTDNQRGRSQ